MAQKKGCQDCPDTRRDMSRGEFLKTSAVAAGGVAVGGGRGAEAASAATRTQAPGLAGRCESLSHDWAIPAGLLNIFWADIYPRLVALHWKNGNVLVPDMPINALKTQIAGIPRIPGTEFNHRVELFLRYLAWDKAIPINVRGDGGYDFVLTSGTVSLAGDDNGGLVLFIPPKPDGKELMRFFTFRQTGRPALGVPDYLDGPYSGVSIDAPTGPNKLTLSPFETQQIQTSGCGPLDVIPVVGEHGEETDRGIVKDIHDYKCRHSDRCWQIEGAVYRGLVTEVARIVAIIWFEELARGQPLTQLEGMPAVQTGIANATASGVNVQAVLSQLRGRYKQMFTDPSNDGLRRIFEERLEMTLPGSGEMAFEIRPSDNTFTGLVFTDGLDSGGKLKEPSLATDVIITRKGFFFPRLPKMNKTAAQLFDDLANGLAGNPVFTSSERTLQT